MRDIEPDSEENQRQSKDNANYVGGLQLQAIHEQRRNCADTIATRVKSELCAYLMRGIKPTFVYEDDPR